MNKFIYYFDVTEENKLRLLNSIIDKFDLLSPFKNRRCFVKPNMVSSEPYPTTTDPLVLKLVLRKLKEHCKEIVVGDAPAQNFEIKDHDLYKVATQEKLVFKDLYKTDFKTTTVNGLELKLSIFPTNFDHSISLPVFKEHAVSGFTFALKNNFGFLDADTRRKLHRADISTLHKAIALLHGFYQPSLILGDACKIMVDAQEKRWGGKESKLNMFFISNASLELDLFALTYLGQAKRVVAEYLELAKEQYRTQPCVIQRI